MKIAFFFSTSGHSGVDRSAELLIPALCQLGYQVDLLQVRKHGPYISPMDNLRLIDLGTKHTMTALGAVKRYLKDQQPDVLLADKDRCNRVALLAKKISGAKTRVVVSSGTIMSENLKNRSWLEGKLHQWSFSYLYPKAHTIITPSVDAAVDLAEISSLDISQIDVVPLPIIAEDLKHKAKESLSHPWLDNKDQAVIISVGELTARKDQSTLLKAFALLQKQQASRLLILGKGKDETKLKHLCVDLGISDQVDFLGYQQNPYKYLKQADVFVHTAKFEGFGMVLVEALALGLPAVAADCIGGPAEILQKGKLGLLTPVSDESALAKALYQTLQKPPSNAEERKQGVEKYTVAMSTLAYLKAMGIEHKPL